ncbi:RHS repeat domain-containing protein [Flavobacterium frigoritolerans]|uniref:RHS repeat domain-containing protein n=1 Tax=Flavobacterium frigoritolerans TaxID=2987686 RepID=UPI00299D49AA|nr:RHS repeat-associated core domain-containing protein [Flavobacterium frigoritolerans]
MKHELCSYGNVLVHEWKYPLDERPKLIVVDEDNLVYDKPEPIENLITWVYEEGSFVPTAKIIAKEKFSIVNDYIGRPVQVYSEVGELVWETDYDIYGGLKDLKGDRSFIPFRQLGQYEDVETELYYNRYRYYSPDAGVYLSQDPIRLKGGFQLYNFVSDTNWWVDLFGLTGTYIFVFDSGHYYIGKGPIDRSGASQDIRTREVKALDPTKGKIVQGAHMDWGDDKTGFLVEQELINRKGAVADPNGLNRINQPGVKPLEEMKLNDPAGYADIVKKADDLEAKLAVSTGKIKCK